MLFEILIEASLCFLNENGKNDWFYWILLISY